MNEIRGKSIWDDILEDWKEPQSPAAETPEEAALPPAPVQEQTGETGTAAELLPAGEAPAKPVSEKKKYQEFERRNAENRRNASENSQKAYREEEKGNRRDFIILGIVLFLAAALLMCCLAGCSGNAGKIRDTLEEFEYACRNLDTDAMLGCIDPDVADPIRLILALYSQATEQDYEDVTDEILENIVYSVFGEDFDPDEFLSTMSVSDVELDVDDEVAVVNCVIHFEVAGEQFARDSAIVLVEIRDRWYISYIDLFA